MGGSESMLPRKKNRNLRSSNCWKCIEIVNLTITLLFLYHFKYSTIPSGGPFWILGGRGVGVCVRAHPAHPSLPTGLHVIQNRSMRQEIIMDERFFCSHHILNSATLFVKSKAK